MKSAIKNLLLTATTLILTLSTVITAEAQNPLKFERESVDLGRVGYKSTTSVTFRFTNVSPTHVVITDAETACGCTKVKFSSKPIIKGATDSLTVRFNAIDKGAFYKKIELVTSQGRQRIAIRGTVE